MNSPRKMVSFLRRGARSSGLRCEDCMSDSLKRRGDSSLCTALICPRQSRNLLCQPCSCFRELPLQNIVPRCLYGVSYAQSPRYWGCCAITNAAVREHIPCVAGIRAASFPARVGALRPSSCSASSSGRTGKTCACAPRGSGNTSCSKHGTCPRALAPLASSGVASSAGGWVSPWLKTDGWSPVVEMGGVQDAVVDSFVLPPPSQPDPPAGTRGRHGVGRRYKATNHSLASASPRIRPTTTNKLYKLVAMHRNRSSYRHHARFACLKLARRRPLYSYS